MSPGRLLTPKIQIMKRFLLLTTMALCSALALGAAPKNYTVASPDGRLKATVELGERISYTVEADGVQLLAPSEISMTLSDGKVYGGAAKLRKVSRTSVDQTYAAAVYKRSQVRDCYNEMTLTFKDFRLVWRAYDEGVAYRFISNAKAPFFVKAEQAEFRFPEDWTMFAPYSNGGTGSFEAQFDNSFESQYQHAPISQFHEGCLAILPFMVEAPKGIKVVIAEADLLNYPGMYLNNADASSTLHGVWAPYPAETEQGGHNMLQGMVTKRADYLAECQAGEAFPWRVLGVSRKDCELPATDLVYNLATPADASADWSWVRPGKVAWDWWNAWNVDGVDFVSGINNDTYKYYIDFASSKGIEYVILDEGWAVNLQADLMQVVPEIDLPMLCKYAASKNVGLILWAGYYALNRDIEGLCKHYSEMGIKGFKVDFMNRDDQEMVQFYVKTARIAAKYGLMIDYHGAYKPTGLQRTYPNVINFEGVFGLEQMKWAPRSVDQVTYDVTIPYIRMYSGPMDYTQGAMRNATRSNYAPFNDEPMSQGTRCRQLAEYVIFDAPFTMLCDTPSAYMREGVCTDFIAAIPTVWDETLGLDGKVGEFVAMARRSGEEWYVGAMTDWSARDITLDLSFLPEGEYTVTLYRDGVNAHRIARDFAVSTFALDASRTLTVHMAPGGGFAAKLERK